jgi:MFS family permease
MPIAEYSISGYIRTRTAATAIGRLPATMASNSIPAELPLDPNPSRLRLPDSVSVLAERDFRVVWFGQAASMSGTWMQVVAQGLLVLKLWDSPFALGAVTFANALPSLLVMLFGGVLADRADKRKILIVTQMAMGLLALAVALLIVADAIQFWMIIVATMCLGVAFGYDMPAYQAFLPELVRPEKISQVVALNSSTFHGSRTVGPAIAGALIGAFGLAAAYFINAASFLAVILSLVIVRHRPRPREHEGEAVGAIAGLKEGFRHAAGRPTLQVLLLLVGLNCIFLFPFIAILMPYYVTEVLNEDAGVLGLMMAMSGVGSLIGALMLIWWPMQARAERIWGAALCGPAGLAILAFTREPAVALVAVGLTSISFSAQLGIVQAMLQESTPGHFRGRVMSLNGIVFNGSMPVAGLAASGLAVAFGLPAVMLGAAVVYLLIMGYVLKYASGGIDFVVRRSYAEYEIVAADV